MNRWIDALKKHENASGTRCQKCQNSIEGSSVTFGTAPSKRKRNFSELSTPANAATARPASSDRPIIQAMECANSREIVTTRTVEAGREAPALPEFEDPQKNREEAPQEGCQKCQNPSRSNFGTFGTALSGQSTNFSGLPAAPSPYVDWTEEARLDLYEERAAIMEYDGGLCREEAEAEAWQEVFGERRSVQEEATGQRKGWLN